MSVFWAGGEGVGDAYETVVLSGFVDNCCEGEFGCGKQGALLPLEVRRDDCLVEVFECPGGVEVDEEVFSFFAGDFNAGYDEEVVVGGQFHCAAYDVVVGDGGSDV